MDLAIVSGLAAAKAILAAKSTAETGPLYMKQLEELLLLPNMRAYSEFHNIFEISRIFKEYPALANQVMQFLFTVDGRVPPLMLKKMLKIIKSNVTFGQMATDVWKAYRSI
jgi:electron transfer flavoprotein-quinone oxidoreductase